MWYLTATTSCDIWQLLHIHCNILQLSKAVIFASYDTQWYSQAITSYLTAITHCIVLQLSHAVTVDSYHTLYYFTAITRCDTSQLSASESQHGMWCLADSYTLTFINCDHDSWHAGWWVFYMSLFVFLLLLATVNIYALVIVTVLVSTVCFEVRMDIMLRCFTLSKVFS